MDEHEILIGRQGSEHLTLPGSEHITLFAKTRSGKTSSFVIPNCLTWPGSLVVFDIKRQAFNATAGHRVAMGQDVYLLDPAADDGRTHCWNPLAAVQRDTWDLMDQISRLAFMLFPEAAATGGSSSNADKFWEPAGRAAYTAVATIVAETPLLPLDHSVLLRLFARGDGSEIIASMIRERRAVGGKQYSQAAIDGVSDYLSGNLEQVEGIRKTVSTRLQPWFNPRIAAATTKSDFNLRDLRRRPMTIYVAVNPSNIARLRPYLALFFEQLVNLNTDVTPEQDDTVQHQALILLDEFARLGHMPTLAHAAQYGAGYGLRMAYIVQDKAQVIDLHGDAGARDIFANSGAEIFFANNDLETTKEVSERFGDTTASAVTKQRPRFFSAMQANKQSESEHVHRRPWILPQEVAMMPSDKQIIFRAGMPGSYTDRVPWFKDPEMAALVCNPPMIPKVTFAVPEDDGKTRILRAKPRHISGITEQDMEVTERETERAQ